MDKNGFFEKHKIVLEGKCVECDNCYKDVFEVLIIGSVYVRDNKYICKKCFVGEDNE